MKTIFIDAEYKCHTVDDGTMTAVETSFFDGKSTAFIEGYRFIPTGKTWVRGDGKTFTGEMAAPWKPWAVLDSAQREYERQQYQALAAQNAEYEAALSEIEAALGVTT